PPLSRIVHLDVQDRPYTTLTGFRILESRADAARATLISPDTCTCADCLRELMDPRDRRYRYPFINCTNCGPRYTIIRDIPYDRDKTTMARFPMCAACMEEYHDPGNRRFHAQPNACSACGPHVWLEDGKGDLLWEKDEALHEVLRLLEAGATVAVKGLGGFHLAAKATDERAVSRLRKRKIREEKPFAVMFPHMDAVREHCLVSEEEEALLVSLQRPIVLLKRRDGGAHPPIAPSVAPNNRHLGGFLPYTPLHHLLFDGPASGSLVMTSGNQSDEPIVMDNDDARERLKDIADFFLLHNRDIYMRCDDSVTRVIHDRPRPIRRARGYVPVPVFLRDAGAQVLGVGAELKNTVCLTRGKEAFLSQHVGDLENLETLRSFEHGIRHLQRILEIEPECIAHDLHPDYLSTQWALQRKDVPLLAVQHHHAHIASVAAEQHLSGPILGLAMDGTGYGSDGTIWGGEILLVDGDRFERLGHFRHLLLPGGNSAIKEPWRMALSTLWALAPDDAEEEF
ncbi:MAG: carbamoyltransferase HypF, partial [Syntrophobacteraceae bacterium]|nr:carbamoyltransferase HypF [Syntrophobacteraceae bacterium]